MANISRNNARDEIKSRCNIIDVIGQAVLLKKAGSNYKGLCPFHNEKTPSFVVSEQKQSFTCFGCGASGDVFSFVQKYYNLEFMEALERLAEQCGVTIEAGYGKTVDKEIYYQMNREAAKYFFKLLRSSDNPAMRYMLNRGLDKDTLHGFGIGYADDSWNGLYDHLTNLGFDREKMLECGLISNSKGKYYDKFRNRVIFPIQNTAGKVIGFGGRDLGNGQPKYLNSQETPVFKKKDNLYGLNLTKTYIGKEKTAIVVEGYMDVISLYQGGIRNVTASLGTALTEDQVRILKRYTSNIILSYDSDNAGRVAAWRGMDIIHQQDCKVKVLTIPEGKDPDDYIKERGKSGFLELTKTALPYADYKFHTLQQQFDMDTTEGRLDFLKASVEVLKTLRPVEADIYINILSTKYNISEGAIRAEYGTVNQTEKRPVTHETEREVKDLLIREKNLIKILLTDSSYFERIDWLDQCFESSQGQRIFKTLGSVYKKGEEIDRNLLMDIMDQSQLDDIVAIDDNIILGGNEEKIFLDCIGTLTLEELKKQEQLIIDKLSMADETDNKEQIISLTKELMDIQKKIQTGGR